MDNFSSAMPRMIPGLGMGPPPLGAVPSASSFDMGGLGGIPGFDIIQRLFTKMGVDTSVLGKIPVCRSRLVDRSSLLYFCKIGSDNLSSNAWNDTHASYLSSFLLYIFNFFAYSTYTVRLGKSGFFGNYPLLRYHLPLYYAVVGRK